MDSEDPFSSPTNRIAASYRVKRDATSAQLMESDLASSRIKQKAQEFSTQMEKASLERKLIAADAEKKELELRLTQKDRLIAKLEKDRRWLADREKEEREEKEEERREREEEKKQSTATIRDLRVELSTLRNEHAELQDAYSNLKRTSAQTINSQKSHVLELTRQAGAFEEELVLAKQVAEEHERTAQMLRTQLEEAATEKSLESQERRGSDEEDNWRVVREELHRQAAYMRSLESTNAKLTGELSSLKERHVNMEVLKEEKRDLERKVRVVDELRSQVVRLEAEVEAARQEREQWAQVVSQQTDDGHGHSAAAPPSVSISHDLADLRLKNALLQEELGGHVAALRQREKELAEAETRETEAKSLVSQLEADVKELRNQATRRQARLELAEREVGFLKALVASYNAEEPPSPDQDEARRTRILSLEETVDKLKAENDKLEKEILSLGSGVRHGTSWLEMVKRLEEVQVARETLEKDMIEVQAANDKAAQNINTLEQTLFELRGDIASGAHVPPKTRVLTMRENPFQQWSDLRQEVVDRLKSENDALLKRLADLEASGATAASSGAGGEEEHLVPRESWEKEHKEKCELEEVVKQKEKRLLRLQQVFSSKAKEFSEAMSSILGYKLHFYSNGQVRVTSQYDLNTSFVFQPTGKKKENDDDEGITMQLVRGGESSLPDLPRTVDYWVNQRMCIPGLMATVTLECYDMTRRGQSQAWTVST